MTAPAGYVRTFNEDFTSNVSRWKPTATKGVWKPNFAFNPNAFDLPHSRSLPAEKQLYVDVYTHKVEPMSRVDGVLNITIKSLAGQVGPKFVGAYADSMKPAVGFKKPFPYGSALLSTEKSFSQTYGYFEARMGLPCIKGGWPAFWLLGYEDKDKDGAEIDIIEHMGVNPQRIERNVHFDNKGLPEQPGRVSDMPKTFNPKEFHDYGVLWTKDFIAFFIDGVENFRVKNPGLHKPMYLIVNYAVGGWGGNMPEDPKIVGSQLKVDWVRAYAPR
jgi:hypothetical protein